MALIVPMHKTKAIKRWINQSPRTHIKYSARALAIGERDRMAAAASEALRLVGCGKLRLTSCTDGKRANHAGSDILRPVRCACSNVSLRGGVALTKNVRNSFQLVSVCVCVCVYSVGCVLFACCGGDMRSNCRRTTHHLGMQSVIVEIPNR